MSLNDSFQPENIIKLLKTPQKSFIKWALDKITCITGVHSKYRLKKERECVPSKKVFTTGSLGRKIWWKGIQVIVEWKKMFRTGLTQPQIMPLIVV